NVALLDASYGGFEAAGCTALQQSALAGGLSSFDGCTTRIGPDGSPVANQDLKGRQLPNAPDYSGSIFADYSRPMGDSLELFVSGDINFTDDYFLAGDLDPLDIQQGFEKINVRLGIRSESWEVMLYGKNITDEETASGGFDIPLLTGSHAIYTDPGEIYGVRASYSF
ncbi:MAG: TonB-dependent receptor, partial [Gammaproteobacteria bacterium]|nr:TonB-dependent receptor [Gammaproteobacteria bacterium]